MDARFKEVYAMPDPGDYLPDSSKIKSRPEASVGFVPVHKRWVVEKTFAWFGNFRRLSKDVEKTIKSSEATVQIAGISTLLNRLTPRSKLEKYYRSKIHK